MYWILTTMLIATFVVTGQVIIAIMTCLIQCMINIEKRKIIWQNMMRWLFKTIKHRKRTRTKKHAMSYYTYGNKQRMARVCRNRLSRAMWSNNRAGTRPTYPQAQCLLGSDKKLSERRYIGIDTMSTYCLTPNESDFIGSTHDIDVQVRGDRCSGTWGKWCTYEGYQVWAGSIQVGG
jgi:hypothetical protein